MSLETIQMNSAAWAFGEFAMFAASSRYGLARAVETPYHPPRKSNSDRNLRRSCSRPNNLHLAPGAPRTKPGVATGRL